MHVSENWRQAYPGASVAGLAMHRVQNPTQAAALQARSQALEQELRRRLAGANRAAILSLPSVRPYVEYYKRVGKTYHLLLQLESVVFKERPITAPSALVHAMVLAEMENMLLTAGHDLAMVNGDPVIEVSNGTETYTTLGGRPETLKPGDMFIRDETGILSSILYGPDRRSRITPDTRDVLFLVYAPAGIPPASVEAHLEDLETAVRLFSPDAEVLWWEVRVAT